MIPVDTAQRPDVRSERIGRFGSLGSIVHLLVLLWAAAIASFPLNDNSFFTHLATGRIILDEGNVPTSDPYTFSAQGEPWTVQSWLASVAYAGFEAMVGEVGLRLLVLATFLLAATLLWRLTAPATSIIIRLSIMSLALLVVSDLWSERPYMIGVIGLSLVWMALNGRVPAWILVPLLWIWANTHGSFPLALVLCAAVVVGSILDRRSHGASGSVRHVELRCAGAALLGVMLAAVGPLGPAVWVFPLTGVTKATALAEVVEWQAPDYRSVSERAFLVLVAVTMLLSARRPGSRWRLVLPAVGFASMGLLAQRNVVMAAVVLVAVCAERAPAAGSLSSADRPARGRTAATLVAVLVVVVAAVAVGTPIGGFGGYPVRPIAHLANTDVGGRIATEMPAGNLLEVLDGADGSVFIDDRVDMFPDDVFQDFLALRRGTSAWDEVLNRYDISTVVWDRAQPLSALLATSPDWAISYADTDWLVACRRADAFACP